ncbi:MAG: biotin--[acetyl-CoA-carboxylase] ligase [Bryobacterales bacterium]|nr:biotin--[acetyl-CoA-carboxylase] ligase [Bryobacterales bacterium]MBV9400064.1 biotin--[acetyl-CoA-carboxylase] ligase [Bryobacterales bacterium]
MTRRIERFERVDSTMTIAAKLAAEGCAGGTIVIADEQTAGIGRHGHSWVSEKGTGLYASMVLRLPVEARALPVVMLALGLAARDAIIELTTLVPDLRWPNDILIAGKKSAGILAQLEGDAIIAGIGINIAQTHFPPGLETPATSLVLEGARVDREELLAALAGAVDRYCAILVDEGAGAIVRIFEASSSYARGRRVRVQQTNSAIEGVTEGLDESGFLMVRQDDGNITTVLAGGVR